MNEIDDNPHFVVSTKIGFENKIDFDDKKEREYNNLYALKIKVIRGDAYIK